MARVLAGALIGVVCTVIFYFIPAVNAIAPLLSGFLAGYYADGGFEGGLKTGVLMTIFMVIPGIFLVPCQPLNVVKFIFYDFHK
jgi:hypothetical protein